ncbi:hypothetical protein CVT24_008873 [Panaeolus cyanescens]|uniref:NAD-dependent epimerase/dehydratase domain-containing protein n=1 Tax=Panaeolus cyanescens TaxID=181874 RepID=A0A409VEB2_9AGAR|nr:hypothetical protein CVT24_008873 [Panaeolus cyanescens]
MPAIEKNNKVLVSGANGYIAMWVVRHFLERGYRVRGTARNEEKCEFMRNYFSKLGYGEQFEAVVVEDITKEGAFDEAVKDVDGIAHTASPFHMNAKTADELIIPAVQGTVGMLKSALKNGSKVRRIVVTSSCASVMSPPSVPTQYCERDWNQLSVQEVKEKGDAAAPMTIYRASKTLAERSAWEFHEKHKAEISWDLSVINPPFVFGPPIHDVSSVKSLNTSLQMWYDKVVLDKPQTKEELSASNSWVDVRDTALAHVLALEKPDASGFIWQEWLDAANSLSPNPWPGHTYNKGFPEVVPASREDRVYHISYDKAKEQRILGIKFHTSLETTKDTLEDFAARGW